MSLDVLLGLQWGDEGKGKIIDYISPEYDIVARFQGGANAGHTIIFNGEKHILHLIPSGIFRDNIINVIGTNVVIDPITLKEEIIKIEKIGINVKSRLKISKKAHITLPTHKLIDEANEKDNKIGTTLKGIGPTYRDKISREGIRIEEIKKESIQFKFNKLVSSHIDILKLKKSILWVNEWEQIKNDWFEAIEYLKEYEIIDTEIYLNNSIKKGKKILAEGAQGSLLDINHGTYPYVTSSETTISGVISGLGIAPKHINKTLGVIKAYTTRVGNGEFETEIKGDLSKKLINKGNEYGSTTGRERRVGWLNLIDVKYHCMINGITDLVITKSDVLTEIDKIKVLIEENNKNKYIEFKGWKKEISKCKYYDELPKKAKKYFEFIEDYLDVKIKFISVGPDRNQIIY